MAVEITGDLVRAARALIQGHLVAIPTETVYGLAADAENEAAVAKIYRAKNRPSDHPLIIHLAGSEDLNHFATDVPEYAQNLIQDFWPGPMTLILKRTGNSKDFVTGNQETVGVRVPNHPVALELLKQFVALGGHGLAAPSANRYGYVSPTTAQAVQQGLSTYLSDADLILEGGPSEVGVESTIIDCTSPNPRILRPGAISAQMIEGSTGIILDAASESNIRVSGSHKQHYSPNARVLVNQKPEPGDGLIAPSEYSTPDAVIRLASPRDAAEYARALYAALSSADQMGLKRVCVIEPEGEGLAIAIRDRIMRAAAREQNASN